MDMVMASTAGEWRTWLAANSGSAEEVWLVVHHKDSGTASVRYHEAVEQALCFGWERATRMTELGLMTAPGQAMIDLAKATGRWEVHIPAEVRTALEGNASFRTQPPSAQRLTLEWIATARRPETRERRLARAIQRLG
jgi:uncharacterized protein YdeI (YjbR/CyaY-like superfamily)